MTEDPKAESFDVVLIMMLITRQTSLLTSVSRQDMRFDSHPVTSVAAPALCLCISRAPVRFNLAGIQLQTKVRFNLLKIQVNCNQLKRLKLSMLVNNTPNYGRHSLHDLGIVWKAVCRHHHSPTTITILIVILVRTLPWRELLICSQL